MRMLSTSSLISYLVEVQILVEVIKEYLFRRLLTKENRPSNDGLFSFPFSLGIEDSHHSAKGAGFAFERNPSGSSLTGGEAKNLRASHECPYSPPPFNTNRLQSPLFYAIII